MRYNIPALDALNRAENTLLAELDVFRAQMDVAAAAMSRALAAIQAASKAIGGVTPPAAPAQCGTGRAALPY